MATIAPPKKETAPKEIIKKPVAVTEISPPNSIKPLQLKLPEEKKNEYKAYAAKNGKLMNELFLEMFAEYKEKYGE